MCKLRDIYCCTHRVSFHMQICILGYFLFIYLFWETACNKRSSQDSNLGFYNYVECILVHSCVPHSTTNGHFELIVMKFFKLKINGYNSLQTLHVRITQLGRSLTCQMCYSQERGWCNPIVPWRNPWPVAIVQPLEDRIRVYDILSPPPSVFSKRAGRQEEARGSFASWTIPALC